MLDDDQWLTLTLQKQHLLLKNQQADINYVYTAMHGVGYEVLSKTLTKAGLATTSYCG